MIKDYLCTGMTIDYYTSVTGLCNFLSSPSKKLVSDIHKQIEKTVTVAPLKVNEVKLPPEYQSQLKTCKFSISALLEDFVQVNLQFFYFEKYLMGMSGVYL